MKWAGKRCRLQLTGRRSRIIKPHPHPTTLPSGQIGISEAHQQTYKHEYYSYRQERLQNCVESERTSYLLHCELLERVHLVNVLLNLLHLRHHTLWDFIVSFSGVHTVTKYIISLKYICLVSVLEYFFSDSYITILTDKYCTFDYSTLTLKTSF